jgi:hypothetical protein
VGTRNDQADVPPVQVPVVRRVAHQVEVAVSRRARVASAHAPEDRAVRPADPRWAAVDLLVEVGLPRVARVGDVAILKSSSPLS